MTWLIVAALVVQFVGLVVIGYLTFIDTLERPANREKKK